MPTERQNQPCSDSYLLLAAMLDKIVDHMPKGDKRAIEREWVELLVFHACASRCAITLLGCEGMVPTEARVDAVSKLQEEVIEMINNRAQAMRAEAVGRN